MAAQKNTKSKAEQEAFEAVRKKLAAEFRLSKEATHICAEMTDERWGGWSALTGFSKAASTLEKIRLIDNYVKSKLASQELASGRQQPDLNRYRPHLLQMVIFNLRDGISGDFT